MPDKEGSDDEKKSTKSVVNKKQKQMMGEEGYDQLRDQGRIRKTKGKSDATTMPVSDEVRKTQKVNTGPSALDRVLKKYGKSVMDVGKKKVDEQLDLTKIAEAFGGYIVEAKSGGKNSKNNKNVEPEFKGTEKIPVTKNEPVRVSDPNFQSLLDIMYGTKTSSQIDAEILRRRTPTDIAARELAQKRKADLPVVKKVLQKTAKKAKVPDLFTNKLDKNIDTTKPIRDKKGNIIANPPEVTYGKGDGRKAGRKGKTVTYTTPDKITSSKSKQKTPTYKISTTPLQGPKRARSKTATQNRVLQKIRIASRSAKRPVQRLVKPAPSVARKSLTATAKGIKKNPFAALVGASVAKDTFFPAALPKPPTVQGGKVGRRTAG